VAVLGPVGLLQGADHDLPRQLRGAHLGGGRDPDGALAVVLEEVAALFLPTALA